MFSIYISHVPLNKRVGHYSNQRCSLGADVGSDRPRQMLICPSSCPAFEVPKNMQRKNRYQGVTRGLSDILAASLPKHPRFPYQTSALLVDCLPLQGLAPFPMWGCSSCWSRCNVVLNVRKLAAAMIGPLDPGPSETACGLDCRRWMREAKNCQASIAGTCMY